MKAFPFTAALPFSSDMPFVGIILLAYRRQYILSRSNRWIYICLNTHIQMSGRKEVMPTTYKAPPT